MQSPGSKSKRPRKNAEESSATLAQTPGAVGEETSKIRRKAIAPKTATEPTPAAKQHRGAAKKAPVAIVETAASASAPAAHADIATLAYSYWVQRGYQGGSAEEDWFRAEKQLLSRTIKP